ncbi:hypothetical protein ACP6PL_29235 [Dapis sp. BLCC M126]|uniref:hypothetical protein n=1 Tax=Dapis sp. BLCC M126 TaxID=3400189 RepID=UPI003CECED6E
MECPIFGHDGAVKKPLKVCIVMVWQMWELYEVSEVWEKKYIFSLLRKQDYQGS